MPRAVKTVPRWSSGGFFSPYTKGKDGKPQPIVIAPSVCVNLCAATGLEAGPYERIAWAVDRPVPKGHEAAAAMLRRVAELAGGWPELSARERSRPKPNQLQEVLGQLDGATRSLLTAIEDLDEVTSGLLAEPSPEAQHWYCPRADLPALLQMLRDLETDIAMVQRQIVLEESR